MATKRYEICSKCPDLKNAGGINNLVATCRLCGCVVRAKVQLKSSRCPVGKWESEV